MPTHTTSPGLQPSHKKRSAAGRRITLALLFTLLLLCAIYAATPMIASQLLSELAADQDMAMQIDTRHPGWRDMHINALQLSTAELKLSATNITLYYTPADLLRGKLQKVHIAQLDLTMLVEPQDTDMGTEELAQATPSPPLPPLDLTPVFESLPFLITDPGADVTNLTINAPHLDFVGRGSAFINRSQAGLSLDGISPAQASNFALQAEATSDNKLSIRFFERGDQGQQFLHVTAAPRGNNLALQAAVDLRGLALDLFALAVGLPPGRGQFKGKLDVLAPASIPQPMTATYLEQITASADHIDVTWQTTEAQADTPDVQVDVSATQMTLKEGDINGSLTGTVAANVASYLATATFPDNFAMRFQQNMLTTSPLQLTFRGDDLHGRLSASVQISTTTPLMLNTTGDLQVTTSAASTQGDWQAQAVLTDSDPLTLTTAVNLSGNALVDEYPLPYTLATQLNMTPLTVQAAGVVTSGTQISLPFDINHNLQSGKGTLDMRGPISWQAPLLASVTSAWTQPLDSPQGALNADIKVQWGAQTPIAAELTMQVTGADMQLDDDMYLQALAGNFTLKAPDLSNSSTWQLQPTDILATELDVGVPMRDLQTRLSGNLQQIRADKTTARILGGTLHIDDVIWDVTTGSSDLTVVLTDINLAEVLALEGEHVSGTGKLSGSIPVSVKADGVTVNAGTVTANPPLGTLQLSPDLTAPTGRAELDFALKALENFTFTRLESGIDYQANGDLLLTINLLGNNPDFERGRAVNYNLQVGENIPALLESLRIQDTFTNKIENALTR